MAGDLTLAIRVKADGTAQVVGDLGRIQKAVADTEKATRQAADMSSAWAKSWHGLMGAIGVGTFTALARGALSFADSIVETADAVGLTTKRFQELRFAAMQNGVSAQQFASAMGYLGRKAGEAGLTAEQAISAATKEITEAKNQSDKLAASWDWFGRGAGRQMVLVLDNSARAAEVATGHLRAMSGVMEDEVLRSVAAANDKIDAWINLVQVGMVTAINAVLPSLDALSQKINQTRLSELAAVRDALANDLRKMESSRGGWRWASVFDDREIQQTRDRLNQLNETILELQGVVKETGETTELTITPVKRKITDLSGAWDESAFFANKSAKATGSVGAATKAATKAITDHRDAVLEEAKALNLEYVEMSRGARARKEMELAIEGRTEAERQYLLSLYDRNEALKLTQEGEEKAREQTQRLAEEGDLAGKALERTAERMTDAFSEFFSDVFRNGIDSFKNLVSTIKDLFFRLLGDLMAAALANPIRIMVGMGGALGAAGASAAQPTRGGLMSYASNTSSMFGGTSIGTAFERAGTYISSFYPAWSASGAVATPLWASSQAGTVFSTGSGGVFSGAASTPNWGYGLAGIGGSLLANALFKGRGYSSLGGGLGATGGMALGAKFGAFGGPIGAVAGSLIGGLVGSLFGGKKKKSPTIEVGTGLSAWQGEAEQGPFGTVAIGPKTKRVDAKDFQDVLSSIVQLDKVIADSVGSAITEQVKSGLAGWTAIEKSVGKSGPDWERMIGERMTRIAEIMEQSSDVVATDVATAIRKRGKDLTSEDLAIASTYRTMFDPQEAIGPFSVAVKEMRVAFEQARPQVESLGLDVQELTDGLARGMDALRKRFDTDIERQIKQVSDPLGASLDALGEEFKTLRNDAITVGGSVDSVDKLFRQKLLALFGQDIPSRVEALTASLEDLQSQLQVLDAEILAAQVAMLDRQISGIERSAESAESALRLMDEQISRSVSVLQSSVNGIKQASDEWQRLSQLLSGTIDSLSISELSPLPPDEQYQEARKQFEALANAAATGDQNAIAGLANAAESFLSESRSYFASGDQYTADFNTVQAALGQSLSYAQAQSTVAEQQLSIQQAQLDAQVALLAVAQDQSISEQQLAQMISQRETLISQMAQDAAALEVLRAQREALTGTNEITKEQLNTLLKQREDVVAQLELDRASLEELRRQTETQDLSKLTFEEANLRIGEILDSWRNNPLATGETIPVTSMSTVSAIAGSTQSIVAAQKETTVAVNALGGALYGLNGTAAAGLAGLVSKNPYSGKAAGGLANAGLHLVGEEGPELVQFRQPARVYTAAQTAAALSAGGADVVRVVADSNRILMRLETLMERQIEATGQVARAAEGTVSTRRVA